MNPLIVMAIIVAVPTLAITLFRVKAALVFMALCTGSVLSLLVGDAAQDMVQTFSSSYNTTTESFILLALLLAPVLLTLLFLNRTVSGSKLLINIFPAFLTGVTALFLVVPLLPDGTKVGIYNTATWDQLVQYQAILIGVAVSFSLGQLWAGGNSARHKKSKHK